MEARLDELRAELELEQRLKKKVKSLNKALVRELRDERRKRDSMERKLEDLSEEITKKSEEMERLKLEVVEERKMMRVAQVFREERVRMKLLEAKFVMDEKLHENEKNSTEEVGLVGDQNCYGRLVTAKEEYVKKKSKRQWRQKQRKEAENPHIRRGIIGHVEFPTRLVRSGDLLGSFLGSQTTTTREGSQLRLPPLLLLPGNLS